MKRITVIDHLNLSGLLPKFMGKDVTCWYLSNDWERLVQLKSQIPGEIRTLGEMLDTTFQEYKEDLLKLYHRVNTANHSLEWWANQVSTKSTTATPLTQNILYLICAKKIIAQSQSDIVFITDSMVLSKCIVEYGHSLNLDIKWRTSLFKRLLEPIQHQFYYLAQILNFIRINLRNKLAVSNNLEMSLKSKTEASKRVVLRSWITEDTFSASGKYNDRNFGELASWLEDKQYEVLLLPTFFNLKSPLSVIIQKLKAQNLKLVMPEQYLKLSDYLGVLKSSYQGFNRVITNVQIAGLDVSPIFNEVLKKAGFNVHLSILNLCVPTLKRLSERGFEVDAFYYPFECNASENPFILACRQYYPDSKIIGFQHTTFFGNQLTYHLADGEWKDHPLPDQIICSGPKYRQLHIEARFPQERIVMGSNLRFAAVYKTIRRSSGVSDAKKMLLLPLTFGYDLAFELFTKLKAALQDSNEYKVVVRMHPLLSKDRILRFLETLNLSHWEFDQPRPIQESLTLTHAVVTTGGSIAILEAMMMAVPVIRVIPDNAIYHDPFHLKGYALKPVVAPLELKNQIRWIETMNAQDKLGFEQMAQQVLNEYFTQPSEENLKVFLLNSNLKKGQGYLPSGAIEDKSVSIR